MDISSLSGANSNSSGSSSRIFGLASGMDIDKMVADLMKAERTRVDKLYQQRQLLEWEQQDYRDLNLKLKSFADSLLTYKLQGTYLKYKATGTMNDGTSADSYFTATPGASATAGSYTFNVSQLADSAKAISSSAISKPLTGSALTAPVTIDGTHNQFVINLDGVEKTITLTSQVYDGTTKTLADLQGDLQTKIDAAFGSGRIKVGLSGNSLTFAPDAAYNQGASLTFKDAASASALGTLGFANGAVYHKIDPNQSLASQAGNFANTLSSDPISFQINGKTFTFNTSNTLNDILAQITADPDIGVTASYDAVTDQVSFKSKATGAAAVVQITNTSGNLFGENGALKVATGTVTGQNAVVSFNGTTVQAANNSFSINGIQFNLKQPMKDTLTTANIQVAFDTDAVVSTIKDFVTKYNDTISAINTKLNEKRNYDYPPLTDEQKSAMKDDDIKKWEEKAHSGLLRGDAALSGAVESIRQVVYSPVAGLPSEMDSLYDLGITTGSYAEQGKLYLDETKLRDALAKDPGSVMKMFTDATNGIATKLYNTVHNTMEMITAKAGGGDFQVFDNSVLGQNLRDLNARISTTEDQLKAVEDRYYRQFTAMEQAIQSMNQQSAWLAAQFSQGQG